MNKLENCIFNFCFYFLRHEQKNMLINPPNRSFWEYGIITFIVYVVHTARLSLYNAHLNAPLYKEEFKKKTCFYLAFAYNESNYESKSFK